MVRRIGGPGGAFAADDGRAGLAFFVDRFDARGAIGAAVGLDGDGFAILALDGGGIGAATTGGEQQRQQNGKDGGGSWGMTGYRISLLWRILARDDLDAAVAGLGRPRLLEGLDIIFGDHRAVIAGKQRMVGRPGAIGGGGRCPGQQHRRQKDRHAPHWPAFTAADDYGSYTKIPGRSMQRCVRAGRGAAAMPPIALLNCAAVQTWLDAPR